MRVCAFAVPALGALRRQREQWVELWRVVLQREQPCLELELELRRRAFISTSAGMTLYATFLPESYHSNPDILCASLSMVPRGTEMRPTGTA